MWIFLQYDFFEFFKQRVFVTIKRKNTGGIAADRYVRICPAAAGNAFGNGCAANGINANAAKPYGDPAESQNANSQRSQTDSAQC